MSPVDQIKQKLDIVDFIGQYVALKKAGRNYKACCPFHQEKSPSFVISPDRQIWHCFGSCGTGGDVIGFWMRRENLTFREALKDLAEKTGIVLDANEYSDEEHTRKESLLSINTLAAKYFAYILKHTPQGAAALEYLHKRGLRDQIIDTFEIGFAPDSWDSLIHFFAKKSITPAQLIEAGLVVQNDPHKRPYDRFRNRIVFPIKDARGVVVGFSGRVLQGDAQGAKYVNTPETAVYHKRESLYGIHLTKEAIRKADNVYVVEGEFDLITPFQAGVSNIVAIKGSALTDEQLQVLKRFTNRITLALDTDEAGIEAMKRGIRVAEQKDFEIHVVQFRTGKDPDEAVHADPIMFKEDLERSVPLYDFLISHFQKKYPEPSPFQKKKLGEEIAPFLVHILNPIVRSHYVRKVADILDVEKESVETLLKTVYRREKNSFYTHRQSAQTSQLKRNEMIQRYMVSILLQEDYVTYKKQSIALLEDEDFSLPYLQQIVHALKQYSLSHHEFTYKAFLQTLKSELWQMADELLLYYASATDLKDDNLAQLIYDIKRNALQELMSKLSQSDSEEHQQRLSEVVVKMRELNKNEIEKRLQTV